MLDRSNWEHLIPHAGSMCLLDAVASWDDTAIHAVSETHARDDHPLRSEAGLHVMHLIEYGAQATAVHGALRARSHNAGVPRPGLLVSVRDVVLAVECVPSTNGRLDVHAQCLYADDGGAQYAFQIDQAGTRLASGRAAVIHPDG